MSENRFLQSCSALLASAILVCGTHLLLIASTEYGRPDVEHAQASRTTPSPVAAPAAAREAIEIELTSATPQRSHADAAEATDDRTASIRLPADSDSPTIAPQSERRPVETAAAQSPSTSEPSPSEDTSANAQAEVPAQAAEEKSAALPDPVAPEPVTPAAGPSELKPVEPVATAAAEVSTPTQTQVVAETASAESVIPEPVVPEPVAPDAEATAGAQPAEPAKSAEGEAMATVEPQPIEAASAAPVPDASAQQDAATVEAPATPAASTAEPPIQTAEPVLPASAGAKPKAPSQPSSASANQVAEETPGTMTAEAESPAPAVPLPKRKPVLAEPAKLPKATATPAVAAAEPKVKEIEAPETKPRWTPMTLAPAGKDTVAKPKLASQRSESAGSYNAKIWSALARHKPRAGKAGSAVVTFSIGPAGGLRSARVSGSSGDQKIDQLALQAVRSAAPFPPPPNPASATYSIRIYLH